MIQILKCKCGLVARHDHLPQNMCPVCYSRNAESITDDIESSILINLLLKKMVSNGSEDEVLDILKQAQDKTFEEY